MSMQIKSSFARAVVAGAFLWVCCTSLGAESLLPTTLEACMSIVPDKERLQCFDRETAALSHMSAATKSHTNTQPQSHTGTAAAVLTPEQKLGLSEDKVRRLEQDRGVNPPKVKELQAHVAQLSGNALSRYEFVLDNGQVWHQSETRSSFSVHPGDLVTVSQGKLGSYWISTGRHNSTRVERVK
jgi:hypothetical protein